MVEVIQAVRGMKDYLPDEIVVWQFVEKTIQQLLLSYGYKEIRLPIVEYCELFKRGVGDHTDIVEKEMYVFENRKGKGLALRPEMTASCVRAFIQHNIGNFLEQKFWSLGPAFRYERPQKGRYRQFHQLSIEVFNSNNVEIEAELIFICYRLWQKLGIAKFMCLNLNTIGSLNERQQYISHLTKFLQKNEAILDQESRSRLLTNPLRILDTKNSTIQALLAEGPQLSTFLNHKTKQDFQNLCHLLQKTDIKYCINNTLVRGLDYYNGTVFEWQSDKLGAQSALCGGGRYDNLVKLLGGKETPAVGVGIGMERLILLIQTVNANLVMPVKPDIYFITEQKTRGDALILSEKLRYNFPELNIIVNLRDYNIKKQFKDADKLEAKMTLILGEYEALNSTMKIKNLTTGLQEIINQDSLLEAIKIRFNTATSHN